LLETGLDKELIKKISKEIKEDNDCTQSDLDILLNEMKEIFMSDGDFDVMEQAAFRFMKKMLKV